MKTCMVAYAFYENDNRVRRYAETLVKRGDEVDAIVLRRDGQTPFEVIKGVNVYRIQKRERNERGAISYLIKMVWFFLQSTCVLTTRHIRARYDIIHVHSVPDFEVFATIPARLMGARVILDIHDIVPEFYASKFKVSESSLPFQFLLFIERLSAAYANHVIISNHLWYQKIIRRSVQPDKCSTIINSPDPSIFYRRSSGPDKNKDDLLICYPGTLNWHQGVDLAIVAMDLLRDRVPNLKCLIVGDGPDRAKISAMVEERHLGQRVTMIGSIPIERVAETMADVDIGIVPKRADSFGNEAFSTKIMEFMATGVPVVAAKTAVDQYYFGDRLVQFFEPGSADDFAAKLLELLNDSMARKELSARALEFIQSNNWDVKKKEYLDLLDQLVKPQIKPIYAATNG